MKLCTALLAMCAAVSASLMGASSALSATRHVVLLFDERPQLPGLAALDAEFVRALQTGSTDQIEIYREAMDLSRFDSAAYRAGLRDFLRQKYADKKIDAAVAVLGPALDFLLDQDTPIFPGAAIVFCGIDRRELGERSLPPHIRGVLIKRQFAPTLEAALGIHPQTRQVVVVAGTSEFDTKLLDQAKSEFKAYESRVELKYLTELPFQNLLTELSRLPPQTVVLFATLFQDGAGEAFVTHDAVQRVSAASNAPTYGFVDQYLGRGIVGGSLYSFAAQGTEAAKLVLKVLAGAEQSTSFLEAQTSAMLFDWRQMQRWSIQASRLPAGSEIRFRNLTVWDRYRGQILMIVAVLLLQAALIAWLLYEHWRRQGAEARSMQQMTELARMNRFATAGQLSAALAHEIRQPLASIASSGSAGLNWLDNKVPDLEELRIALQTVVRQSHRADDVIKGVRALFSHDSTVRTEVDLNELVEQVLALTARSIAVNNIALDTDLPDDPPRFVMADPVQLQQVVLNLIMNAVEAMAASDHGTRMLHIETRIGETGTVVLTIADSGPGFDAKVAAKLFTPFVTTKTQGMGMGLSISKSIIEQHGGELTATSVEPRGARLTLVLPGLQ
jgi:signal transduction histidine kinase